MLELKEVKKYYEVGDTITKALDGISVAFRQKEFVAILGTSGSGKTTLLNVVGGLDKYDSGDMIINGKSTKNFKDVDWDAYRNNTIGFIFQSYNLISHLGIIENVELGMTLSGVSSGEKRKKALEVLEKVGLKDHIHKKPNQLSGGQMQRVAIARALANNPDILLCDEPTGALDTNTSVQIMDLIKEVAKDKLVIMVTHNPELAKQYADRIVEFKDGHIISDSHPHIERPKEDNFSLKKTSMKFRTALNLSFNNIKTKKGRTALTAFASSIGIIGIALILSLSNGFQKQIDSFQSDAMSEFPIMIMPTVSNVTMEDIKAIDKEIDDKMLNKLEYVESDEIFLYDPNELMRMHKNNFSDDFVNYLNNIDKEICKSLGYVRMVNMNLTRKVNDNYVPVSIGTGMNMGSSSSGMMNISSMNGMGLYSYPKMLDTKNGSYLEQNYDVLSGEYPKNKTDLILVVDNKNRLDYSILQKLGFNTDNINSIKFDELVGLELKLINNNDYYIKTDMGNYIPNSNYNEMSNSDKTITLKIVGIVRQKQDTNMALLSSGIIYSDDLVETIINNSLDSNIVKDQEKLDINVLTMGEIEDKDMIISYLGGSSKPYMIMLYPNNFEDKDMLLSYLDDYNKDKEEDDQIIYTDLADTISSMTGGIMNGITMVLVAFASISLIVSSIMIGIITYISVLERTKEIGILKALGARKKDITRVFDAETFLLGLFSGMLGITITYLLTIPINQIIYSATELQNVAQLQPIHAMILITINVFLTILAGHLPARMAAKKDAIEALRTE